MNPAIRGLGGLLAVAGFALIIMPQWVLGPAAADLGAFDTVERRIPGGMALGFGLLLATMGSWRPWQRAVAAVFFWAAVGALVGRLYGIGVDGGHPRQWMWVGVEGAMAVLTFFILRRFPAPKPEAD